MRISIIGTHGIPARYGGFETFAEHLARACANAGILVRVINEKNNPVEPFPEGVEIISSSFNKSESPMKFYGDSLKLASADSDIILCCGVGGAYYYAKNRRRSLKIITNIDGLEHRRRKYSWWQRLVIYFLQKYASRRSDIVVADCLEVWGYWNRRFPRSAHKTKIISYGADECLPFNPSVLAEYSLKKNEYLLVIARLVPENNLEEIIKAYNHYLGKKKLVVVGRLEDSQFVKKIRSISSENVIFTDAIYDKQILDSLRQGSFIYLHGHSVGGANPSLLEAMAAGCVCICHENVFNREITGGGQMYFDDSFDLAIMLNLLEHKAPDLDVYKAKSIARARDKYSWEKCCAVYIELFNKLHSGGKIKSIG